MKGPSPSPDLAVPAPADLADLPAPPRRGRLSAIGLAALTAIASAAMIGALAGDVRYALRAGTPRDLGDLGRIVPDRPLRDVFATGKGLLGTHGAIRYERPLESDSFRLAPVAGNPRLWVEMRVPAGAEGPRFVPPTAFVGRLVPLGEIGLWQRGLAANVRRLTGVEVPPDAWVLVDGAAPASSRWALGLAALFGFFAAWSLVTLVRIVRPIRD